MEHRKLRLDWTAGLGFALALFLLPSGTTAQTTAPRAATRTTLTVNASGQATATVTDLNDDLAVGGVVNFEESGRILAQVPLNANGQASANLTLSAGENDVQAVYAGDDTHQSSVSPLGTIQPETPASSPPSFQLSLTPISPSSPPMTLTAGQTGSLTVTVTPVNNASLTSPMFVTLSCSGLPSFASCSFTPENVEITATTPTSCAAGSPSAGCPPTSLMAISTEAAATGGSASNQHRSTIAWALLLPGIFGLGGISWGARRRRWLQRLSLIAIIGIVTVFGVTGCSPLYRYYNHSPTLGPQTPAGTYTVTITAQSSNGVTSTSQATTMVLQVK